jgi:branched-chain amino acid transport system ATP-binding protein
MPILEINNLKHYFGGLCAVSDFNLKLEPGELVSIIGPNGAGKTTVFNLITGVYRPTQGKIIFKEMDITGKRPDRITSLGIARTFQNIRLFNNLSVMDNVRIAHFSRMHYHPLEAIFHIGRYSGEEDRISREAMDLMSRFDLEEYAGAEAGSLPYGMQRRLEIVRALATKPALLLLDEPAAGMNPNEIDKLMNFIRYIQKEFSLTIILIEHQMRLVMGICKRILVLDFGVTIAEGNPEQIRSNKKVLEAYLGEEVAL